MPVVDLINIADTFFGLTVVVGYYALIIAVARNAWKI